MPSPLPLSGLKVVDLTRVLAGPFCSMLLGDMGADVIKVEEPKAGDDARAWGPFVGDGWSAYFLGVNRNKRGLAVDLKSAEGADVLKRLLEGADVFIENFRPGSLDKLGFGIEQTRRLNPRLVHCSISGYGKNGPKRHLSGYDPVAQAESGFMEDRKSTRLNSSHSQISYAVFCLKKKKKKKKRTKSRKNARRR